MASTVTPFVHLCTPFTESDSVASVTTLGRVLQRLNSAKVMRQTLEMGSATRNCDVPKSAQAQAQTIASAFLDRALRFQPEASEGWKAEIEGLRRGEWPEGHKFGEEIEDKDSMAMWTNRILYSMATLETSRLVKALDTSDQLRLALEREGQTDTHPLSSLMTAFDSVALTRNRVSGVRARLMVVTAKSDGSSGSLLGILSELDRYYICSNAILACLDLEALSSGDKTTIMINAFSGTRLMSLFRGFERHRSALGQRDEDVDLGDLLAHLRHTLKTEEEDKVNAASITRLQQRAPLMVSAALPAGHSRPRARTGNRNSDQFQSWLKDNRNRCLSCEKIGHLRRDCPAPAPLSALSPNNPLRLRAGSSSVPREGGDKRRTPARGAYVIGPLMPLGAYNVERRPQVDYIVDTGAALVSYLPCPTGMDNRTMRATSKPITVSGVGGTTVVTHVGVAYAKVKAYNGESTRDTIVRFDAAVVPSLRAAGVALISPQSFVYDGGFHAIIHRAKTVDGITLPDDVALQVGAVGALRDSRYRVEIPAEYRKSRSQNVISLVWCTQAEIERVARDRPPEGAAVEQRLIQGPSE